MQLSLLDPQVTFVGSLRSSGKQKYKRYTASPLRYAGGKSLAVGYIADLLPSNVKQVVSPFIGGGSVEIAFANEMGIEVKAYDIFDILCTYWNVQLSDPISLAKELTKFTPNRKTFTDVKGRLNQYWNNDMEISQTDLASHYYFNLNTSYGPLFLGWPSDIYLDPKRYGKMVDKVKGFKSPNLSVECMSFEQSMANHSNDFFYCDPPYYLEDGKTFVGMYPNSNFPIHHKGFKHELLRDYLLIHKKGFILSYNDCDVIRDWYSDFNIETPEWQYTFGQGDTRIGDNRRNLNESSHVKKSHELLIWSHPK